MSKSIKPKTAREALERLDERLKSQGIEHLDIKTRIVMLRNLPEIHPSRSGQKKDGWDISLHSPTPLLPKALRLYFNVQAELDRGESIRSACNNLAPFYDGVGGESLRKAYSAHAKPIGEFMDKLFNGGVTIKSKPAIELLNDGVNLAIDRLLRLDDEAFKSCIEDDSLIEWLSAWE